ncbi:DCC1-like thiol-disulfide oxidoreductase family protein (plasmid) [Pantoea dispersa]|uniref:thiol-disulfide oxidoreductase DCC family protein n=1 Tax=Pantoea dispersa TaxID=59814 RepID=UPI001CA6EDCC|nr:DCC1-like thiol-disulfide oxidoreductase family protein [Pantoea dispersa]QZY92802.1 DCC1-like thiol-disulfide oxidoreductase family protein [Pantoea dispersa]
MSSSVQPESAQPIILYDGQCKLCNAWVIFLLRHRLPRDYHFAAIQSERGKQLLQRAGLPHDNIRTIVLLRDGQHWLRAQAICRIMHSLPWPWRACGVLRYLPDGLTNLIYNLIARNRYRLFGRYDQVHAIEADYPGRFLTD